MTKRACLSYVKSDINYAEMEFQARAVERHGHNPHDFEASFGRYVEASDFLPGMKAQVDPASILDPRSISGLAEIGMIDEALEASIATWKDAVLISDRGEEPVIVDAFKDGVSAMVPLLGPLYWLRRATSSTFRKDLTVWRCVASQLGTVSLRHFDKFGSLFVTSRKIVSTS